MNMIKDITSFIFIENELAEADIIFIPGGSFPEPTERAAALWMQGYAPYVLPSGKYSVKRGFFPGPRSKAEVYSDSYETEWHFLAEVLKKNGVPESAILKEAEAETTLENAFKSKELTDAMGLNIKKAIICCKAFHAKRCLMFYSWAYPDTEFIICPTETQNINRENWFTTAQGIDKVMGELSRCGGQFIDAVPVWRDNK